MKKIYSISVLFFIFWSSLLAFGQEYESDLDYNPVIKKYIRENASSVLKKQAMSDTLSLPFFDDFSKPGIYPDLNLWSNDSVFINTQYPIDPPSIGVATFDGLDPLGSLYPHLVPGSALVADYLTSQPIKLNYLPSDSVYISFYYQSKGLGHSIEEEDSLVLELFSPVTQQWHWYWSSSDTTGSVFRLVMKPITDTIFLQNGFRFRFKNYFSYGGQSEPSWLSNFDQWHIDYVYLDTNRFMGDTITEDIGFVYPIRSALKFYDAMPWTHYQAVGTSILSSHLIYVYRNIGQTVGWNVDRCLDFTDPSGITVPDTLENSLNAEANTLFDVQITFSYPFSSMMQDSANFEMKAYLKINDSTNIAQYMRWNDTTRFQQKFSNYYAYDDGSAERKYGLSGQGAQGSKLAYKFNNYKEDTLRGISIFFNHVYGNFTSGKYFTIAVWSENGGMPGDTLYTQIGERVQYSNEINEFTQFTFTNPIIIPTGNFFLGIIMTTTDNLNIGLDKNRSSQNNLYYNTTGVWQQSSIQGALMMRPLFGKELPLTISELKTEHFQVYPNPACATLYFNYPPELNLMQSSMFISDICGKTVVSQNQLPEQIDVSSLPAGFYFVTIITPGRSKYSRKILIVR